MLCCGIEILHHHPAILCSGNICGIYSLDIGNKCSHPIVIYRYLIINILELLLDIGHELTAGTQIPSADSDNNITIYLQIQSLFLQSNSGLLFQYLPQPGSTPYSLSIRVRGLYIFGPFAYNSGFTVEILLVQLYLLHK